mgnify:CR=1 FL=1
MADTFNLSSATAASWYDFARKSSLDDNSNINYYDSSQTKNNSMKNIKNGLADSDKNNGVLIDDNTNNAYLSPTL